MTEIAANTIVKQAFHEMELRPLSSLADGSPEAVTASEQFPNAVDMVLSSYDWSCARKLYQLPAIANPTAPQDPDLPFQFTLPEEVLVLRKVFGEPHWRAEEREIRADVSSVKILATYRVKAESRLPATLRQAISLQLAVLMSARFVTSRSKRQALKEDLQSALMMARSDDSLSGSQTRLDGMSDAVDWVSEVKR